MSLQTYRELLGQRPFKPFRLVLSSGQAYEVRHPEMALLTRTSLLVGINIADDGVPAEFGRLTWLQTQVDGNGVSLICSDLLAIRAE